MPKGVDLETGAEKRDPAGVPGLSNLITTIPAAVMLLQPLQVPCVQWVWLGTPVRWPGRCDTMRPQGSKTEGNRVLGTGVNDS